MKKCATCLKEKPRAAGTRVCKDCHPDWKRLHSFPTLSEGERNEIRARVGQATFNRLVSLEGDQIVAMRGANSSGSLVGVA